jgi:iron complex outermembrane receptor protein
MKLLKFSSESSGQPALLLNVPDLKFKASVMVQNLLVQNSFVRVFGRFQNAYAFRSGRWDSAVLVQEGKVPARFVADVAAGYTFSNGLAVSANVLNVFNNRSIDQLGSPPGGIMAYAQVAYKYEGLNF